MHESKKVEFISELLLRVKNLEELLIKNNVLTREELNEGFQTSVQQLTERVLLLAAESKKSNN